MNELLSEEIQQFINANLDADLHSLLLKKSPFPGIRIQDIVQQIKGRNTAAKKFPFLNKSHVLFPPQLNLEQASSQDTAEFKSLFFKGKKFLDLTCGYGIDAYFLSKNFEEITLLEQNGELLETVKHNWKVLCRKADFKNQKLEDFLTDTKEHFTLVYLDPARRDTQNRKVFLLEDLSPNILELQEKLLSISDEVLIKLSPLIDLQYLVHSLRQCCKIWIVAVKNEVKEILVHLKKEASETEISCVNLQSEQLDFDFKLTDINDLKSEYSIPKKYLMIPNAAILKSGAFDLISARFGLKKLHPNTHLYTSDKAPEGFPGRTFLVDETAAKMIRKKEQYNIIAKNYPLTPDQIKKKYGINDGGKDYLIFTQSIAQKHILKAQLL